MKEYIIGANGDGDACKFTMFLNEEGLGIVKELIQKCDTYMKTEYMAQPFLTITEIEDKNVD